MSHSRLLSARVRAGLLLLGLLVLGILALRSGSHATPIRGKVSDVDTYHAMIRSIRAGVPYYDAIGGELRRWRYATREVFNWRTPLLMTAEAQVSDDTAKAVLLVLTALLCAAMPAMTSGRFSSALSLAMQFGMLAMFAGTDIYVMSEPWTGVLIGLSLVAYRWRQRALGVGVGLLALFVRELAAPYCVVCTLVAAWRRRWHEVAAWGGGAVMYCAYYAWHLSNVIAHRLPDAISHPSSWLSFGGITSVVTKVYWQGWLILVPMWVTALALVVIVAGLADGRSDGRARLAAAAYLLFFLVAGQPFDWYWGLVAWPTWAIVFAGGPRAIVSSLAAVARRPQPQIQAEHATR